MVGRGAPEASEVRAPGAGVSGEQGQANKRAREQAAGRTGGSDEEVEQRRLGFDDAVGQSGLRHAVQERLWTVSEELTGVKFDI